MPRAATRAGHALATLWDGSAPLTATGVLMIGVLGAALAGLWLDPRTIAGAPAWLKPAKFAASIAIFTLTLAWVFTWLPGWTKTRAVVGWTTAVILTAEILIIGLQAARGVRSHFNVATPFDGTLFSLMGAGIMLQTLMSVLLGFALWRHPFQDRAVGWALRLGLTLTIAGAASGGVMLRPTERQLVEARAGSMTVAGAHSVGGEDGGRGLPGTGWSTEHGDLRVPHFVGLHAIQALALVALMLPRQWAQRVRVRVVFASAASYIVLFGILLRQALGGEPVVAPSTGTLLVLAAWAAVSAALFWVAAHRGARQNTPAALEAGGAR